MCQHEQMLLGQHLFSREIRFLGCCYVGFKASHRAAMRTVHEFESCMRSLVLDRDFGCIRYYRGRYHIVRDMGVKNGGTS
jgi:hypothetical protein